MYVATSGPADEPYVSHAATVAALASLITTPVTVIGFSLGAQLSILLASHHPQLVTNAVIVSAQAKAMPFTGLTLFALGVSAPLARQRWFAKLQARELFVPPHQIEDYIETSAGVTKHSLLAAVGENMRFELPAEWSTFDGRVLVMAGTKERRVMHESASAIHESQPASALTLVEDCGHGIPLQRPNWFGDRVREWLAQV